MANEIATIEQEHLVTQNVDWDVLETHDELHGIMEQNLNPDTGKRWWSARKFAEKMEMKWQDFEALLKNAEKQVHVYFGEPERHFTVYRKTSVDSIGRAKTDDDYRLSTYAVYLILMITRKNTEFVKKAKANFSMLTEIGQKVARQKSWSQIKTEAELELFQKANSRTRVADQRRDATDALQEAFEIIPGSKSQKLPDGSCPYIKFNVLIMLLLANMYPYEIKWALGASIKVPTQNLMDQKLLDCQSLMLDRIAKAIRRARQKARAQAFKNNVVWLGMIWDEVEEIIIEEGRQAIADFFEPGELDDCLFGDDVGIKLVDARKIVQAKLAEEEALQQIEQQDLPH